MTEAVQSANEAPVSALRAGLLFLQTDFDLMYQISKRFEFSASHMIGGLPSDHPCSNLHGHNYVVEVVLAGETLDAVGFIRDYRELSALKTYIDETVDHKHLNDVLGHDRTTAEVLAKWFYDWCHHQWPETVAVRVSETPRTWAEYRPV